MLNKSAQNVYSSIICKSPKLETNLNIYQWQNNILLSCSTFREEFFIAMKKNKLLIKHEKKLYYWRIEEEDILKWQEGDDYLNTHSKKDQNQNLWYINHHHILFLTQP